MSRIQRELIPHNVSSLDHTYQVVQDLEEYMKPPFLGTLTLIVLTLVPLSRAKPNFGNQPKGQSSAPPMLGTPKIREQLASVPSRTTRPSASGVKDLGTIPMSAPPKLLIYTFRQ